MHAGLFSHKWEIKPHCLSLQNALSQRSWWVLFWAFERAQLPDPLLILCSSDVWCDSAVKNNCSAVKFLISLNELNFICIHFAHLQLKIYSVIIWLLIYSLSSPISEDVIELDNIWFLITFYRTSSIPFIISFELSSWCFCAPGHATWSLTAQLSPVGPQTTGLIHAASCQKGGSNQADDSLNGWFGVFLSMWPLCLFLTY